MCVFVFLFALILFLPIYARQAKTLLALRDVAFGPTVCLVRPVVHVVTSAEKCFLLSREVGFHFKSCDHSCIRVIPHERWGNNLLQLLKACQLAESLGIGTVKVKHNFAFVTQSLPWSPSVTVVPEETVQEECFAAKYFMLASNHTIPIFAEFTPSFKRAYRNHLGVHQLNESALVVHLRSGDIFSRWVHRLYAQPPCGYYQNIARSRNWDTILVFSEDYQNPCVRLVAENATFHVGGVLLDDLRLLLGARNLVIGRGTFGLMLALLTEDLMRLYTFNQSFGLQCALRGTRISNCQPSRAFYTRNVLHWRKTHEQVQLMLNSTCESWASGNVARDRCPLEDLMLPIGIT